MNGTDPEDVPRPNWFVGAMHGGSDDQTPRFLREGIWENGDDDKYRDLVREMRPGERIAIKATYTRRRGLPFDNRGHPISVMKIKAVGTITENPNDGKRVRVHWTGRDPREWYFYTYQRTVWKVIPGEWKSDDLIAFTFEGESQNVARFRDAPHWRERLGTPLDERRFPWTEFYEATADKLADYHGDRRPLIEGLHEIASRVKHLSYLRDRDSSGGDPYPLRDICPFTAMGTFNRSVSDSNRKSIAGEMARLLAVDVEVPESFEGVPRLNNQQSWFFGYSYGRGEGDIDTLWQVFAAAREFADSDQPERREGFIRAYEAATKVRGVKWNLSMGLYWVRPWDFPVLDAPSRDFMKRHLGMDTPDHSAGSYLKTLEGLKERFNQENCPVHSFPELWIAADPPSPAADGGRTEGMPETDDADDDRNPEPEAVPDRRPCERYSVDDILADGCFLERAEIERLLDLLENEKNLVLQGPPGTGKTWIAKRLAFALMGEKDDRKLRSVQFHPNMSYEDFVRGWRPSGDGKLAIEDGVFMEAMHAASDDPSSKFVVVIEEINRGNPAQIFGELLTLLEPDKRRPEEALALCYPDKDGKRRPIHVPENLYVVGTMNTADRSLALIDLAFRRRFAFADLEPKIGDRWREWVVAERGVDAELAHEVERRVTELNRRIAEDDRLGRQFRIGHSFVTPVRPLGAGRTKDWFVQAVKSRIGPQLEEYWFDEPGKAKEAIDGLLEGW